MDAWLGAGNTLLNYLAVLAVYACLFVVMRHARPALEPGFGKTFTVMWIAYALVIFVANYLLFLWGRMSFLPWLNNAFHTVIWIGLCLTYLYAGCYARPFWAQFVMFFVFSYAVKLAEHQLLGTWEFGNFFGIPGNPAYILGWSLVDGLTPLASAIGLNLLSKLIPGLVKPRLRLF